jgi:plastocyanin
MGMVQLRWGGARRLGASLLGGAALAAAAAGCGGQAAAQSRDDLIAGKQLFVAKCGACHTLARAGTKGSVGPNLDDAFKRSLQDGMGRSTVRGVVEHQILYPAKLPPGVVYMPAKLVTGQGAADVAAYVAFVSAKGGQDTGLLAAAVKKAGAGKPAVEKAGVLEIDADPTGQLAYVTSKATATPGPVTIKMANKSTVQHDIAIEGDGKGPVVSGGGVSQFKTTLKAGVYTYYCTVDGHRAAGMLGKITVK